MSWIGLKKLGAVHIEEDVNASWTLHEVDEREARQAATSAAIEEVYRSKFHRFLRVAEAICGKRNAYDAVQEAFAGALRSQADFRGESRIETWLWTCVLNAARATRRSALDPVQLGIEEAAPDAGYDAFLVRPLLRRLSDRQLLVVFLRYYGDLDYASIAATLGIAQGTVGATLAQSHSILKQLLQEVDE